MPEPRLRIYLPLSNSDWISNFHISLDAPPVNGSKLIIFEFEDLQSS